MAKIDQVLADTTGIPSGERVVTVRFSDSIEYVFIGVDTGQMSVCRDTAIDLRSMESLPFRVVETTSTHIDLGMTEDEIATRDAYIPFGGK